VAGDGVGAGGGDETTDGPGPRAWVVVEVRDAGLGIPAADLPHVFERFARGSNVAGRIGGSGVGLASVRQIVEQHGGTVSVQSEEAKGTTVTVRLPLAAAGQS
jgi:signal transduction histidine kinase